jgi:hypothetical protein
MKKNNIKKSHATVRLTPGPPKENKEDPTPATAIVRDPLP